jgi:predicted nucleic acid-binding protein
VTVGHPIRERVLHELDQGHEFSVCIPVVTETLFGIGLLPRAVANLTEWSRLRPFLSCYLLDEEDAEYAAELQRTLRLRGRQIATVDAWIAVVALRWDLILLTTDRDFETIPHLVTENWVP